MPILFCITNRTLFLFKFYIISNYLLCYYKLIWFDRYSSPIRYNDHIESSHSSRSISHLRQRRKLSSINPPKKISNNLIKSTVKHLDSVDASKIAKDSGFGAGNKYSRCHSCNEEREIVFEREGFRLCNECLDEFMREHRFKK